MSNPSSEDPEPPGWLLGAGRFLGWSRTQTAWKYRLYRRRWLQFRKKFEPEAWRLGHQMCRACGSMQDRDATVCTSCSAALGSRFERWVHRIGVKVPRLWSASTLLGLLTILIYVRMAMLYPADSITGWKREQLVRHGAVWATLIRDGEIWRFGTSAYLHFGVMHLFYNLSALSQIGPSVEDVYGRGRVIAVFTITTIAAGVASFWLTPAVLLVGASSGIMGLVGLSAGWGHRRRTWQGTRVRNEMLRWAGSTIVFGLLTGGNRTAHAAGFAMGALLGLAISPERIEATRTSFSTRLIGIVATVAALAFTMFALVAH